jgi:hypothetical protein
MAAGPHQVLKVVVYTTSGKNAEMFFQHFMKVGRDSSQMSRFPFLPLKKVINFHV